jgi:hypothetical protein
MKIQAIGFRPLERNTLRGFASLALGSSGLLIHECPVHCTNGRWWVGFPARSYGGADGAQHWKPLIEFGNADSRDRFREQAIAALREKYPEIFRTAPASQSPGARP